MAGTPEASEEETMSDEKILLTAGEVARLTGFAEGTIRHFVSQRRIPFIRISPRCVRFRRSDIEAWLEGLLVLSGDVERKGGVSPCKAREKSKAA
jgi:excisionase family DNA binding protein